MTPPTNRKGETFLIWLEQADRLPGSRIMGSVAQKWLRAPIKIISRQISNLLLAFNRGEITERCLSHLLGGYVFDQIESGRLTFHGKAAVKEVDFFPSFVSEIFQRYEGYTIAVRN